MTTKKVLTFIAVAVLVALVVILALGKRLYHWPIPDLLNI